MPTLNDQPTAAQDQAPEPSYPSSGPGQEKAGGWRALIESVWLPKALIGVFGMVAVAAGVNMYSPGALSSLALGAGSSPGIVTFDPVKFLNAQRAAASILAANPNADLALTITQVATKTDAVIAQHAGGAVVVVRQAVISGTARDITDDVLRDFGLPTNVPTITTNTTRSAKNALSDLAPSDLGFSSEMRKETKVQGLRNQADRYQGQLDLLGAQNQALP